MFKAILRATALLAFLGLPLVPGAAAAASSGATTINSNGGMIVTVPATGQRVALTVTVPITVVCNPLPPGSFGSFGNGHLSLVQPSGGGKVAVGAGDAYWFLAGTSGGGKGGGGGFYQPPQPLICDGITANNSVFTVSPDTLTDPYTLALKNGAASATFSGQICSFGYNGQSCDTVNSGVFTIKVVN